MSAIMRKLLKEYILGDMVARYEINEEKQVGLTLYPTGKSLPDTVEKAAVLDCLVQLKLSGDAYEGCYAPGNTMRNSESVKRFKFQEQKLKKLGENITICTILNDERGYLVEHRLTWKQGTSYLEVECEFLNRSQETVVLEMMESFSLEMISPYISGDCHGSIMIHRLRSRWSQEGCMESLPIEALQLDTCWNHDSVKCERFGQVGSLPVNNFFPWLFVEDIKNKVFWGAQLYHGASWQMELFRKDENFAVSGGLADREFGHWTKRVEPGKNFHTPKAVLTVCHSCDLDLASARLTEAQKAAANEVPETEQDLPIIFNEYCTTWGCPSHENILKILDKIRGKGFTYFVIDCGWYKETGVPWDISMGDYQISKDLFPEGLEKTIAAIKEAGLKPGIWFEFENVGRAAKAFQNTEHLLKLDGAPLTTSRRRFWDLKDPWVIRYLDKHVIQMLKYYGFEYLKVDYNDTIGMGCDGCESLGEGLRQNMIASQDYFRKISREIPGIVIENCASGGHRLEPSYMEISSMASFSDAHECEEIPIIAANLHRAILPRQSQIWAVIRTTDSKKRIAYSIINTFLGRMCLSGDVTELSEEQWEVIDRGINFYNHIRFAIKEGQSYRYGPKIDCIRHAKGWQGVYRQGNNGEAFAVIHIFGGDLPDKIVLDLPKGQKYEIREIYSDTDEEIEMKENQMLYLPKENQKAVAVRFCTEKQ